MMQSQQGHQDTILFIRVLRFGFRVGERTEKNSRYCSF